MVSEFMDIATRIVGEGEVFTPQSVAALIIFCSLLECVGGIMYALLKVGDRI